MKMNAGKLLKIIAAILFGLAAFGIMLGAINLIAAGLCVLTISFLV